jgi:hypothetical protein
MSRVAFGSAILVASLAACGTDAAAPKASSDAPFDAGALALAKFDSAIAPFRFQSGIVTRSRVVIDNVDDWFTIWGKLAANQPLLSNPPDVDFNKYMVVLVASGSKPTSGYCIDIHAVSGSSDGIGIWVTETGPAASLVVSQVLTQPTDLRLIGRTTGAIFFVEDQHIGHCPSTGTG